MSVFTEENIELLRQYFLSDDADVRNKLLESVPSELREKVILIQEEFEKNTDAKSIAAKIGASDFEEEIEEIQSTFLLKTLDLNEQDFEMDIIDAITPLERESLKKKLVAFEENVGEELSDLEIKSALTQIEREYLKKKFQQLDDSLRGGGVNPFYPILFPAAALVSDQIPKEQTKLISFQSLLKYAVAASIIITIGIGIYQFVKQDPILENIVASSSEEQPIDKKSIELPEIETVPLAEVSITTNSYAVLKSGLGYGEIEENITIVVNNQKERVLSIQKAISTYSNQLDKVKEIINPESEQMISEISDRISSLQEELTQLKIREKNYQFDGKVLNLFVSSAQTENKIITIGDAIYLKTNAKFFKLSISKEPQSFLEETDPTVLKALDKIIFNEE